MTFELRPYQRAAVDAVKAELETVDSTLLVASVGAGKTIMQAAFIQDILADFPEARFICAVHTRELVQQNAQAMYELMPWADVGVNSAALGQRSTRAQILFCSVQSVFRDAHKLGHADALIIDECHLISKNSDAMYQTLINGLKEINPDLRILGMSGTPYRMDSGYLTAGDDPLFKTVAYEFGLGQAIAEGFLVPPSGKRTSVTFDTTGVHTRAGDFVASELSRAVNQEAITREAVSEIIRYGADRKAWICFCVDVDHAMSVRDEMRAQGVSCEAVEGAMDAGSRRRILAAYKAGEIRCLTNVNVLSIGFNHPPIDLIALMRPTKSCALYVQQVGRGLRLSPGKENCLVLDYGNVIQTLGPVDLVKPREPGKGLGEAPVRVCPNCFEINYAAARQCVECGHEFEIEEKPLHEARAADLPILSTQTEWLPVRQRRFRYHEKLGGTPSVRAEFTSGLTTYKTWLCPQHGGFAKSKADRWWRQHGGAVPFPATVDEWLSRESELVATAEIAIKPKPGSKYMDVSGFRPAVANDNAAPASNDNAPERWSDTLMDEVPF